MMSEQPSTLAREAKEIHSSLKVQLKEKGPFDKDVDFMRKNLRRHYLNLLLVHPYARESEGAENHLWMQTSYVFISDYKQRLAAIQRPSVEHRKFLQRFRQFLAEEEKFWTQFLLRYSRSFALDEEVHQTLLSLSLISENADTAGAGNTTSNGRNQHRFPTEDPTVSLAPNTPAERESRIAIFSKALICLGDIARYRELYNESGGRSQVGHDESGRRGRNKRGGAAGLDLPRPRNYDRAKQCYEQAKRLVPSDGNPSHQLAILAQYQKDDFTSLVHYYRSLCVKQPYDTASENMGTLLQKAFANWKSRPPREVPAEVANVPKVKIDAFKEKVVVLHALWRLGLAKYDSKALKQQRVISEDFYSFVAERHLPEDFILQMIILAQGALWKIRMYHESSLGPKSKSNGRQESSSEHLAPSVIEARVYTHMLSLHRALLEVGIQNLKEPLPPDSENDLAQRLIVEFRRTLPALRIAGKWLRANFTYVMSDPESLGTVEKGKSKAKERRKTTISASSTATIEFWEKYSEFLRSLSRNFPTDRLPDLTFILAEDTEMKGFRPLKDALDQNPMARKQGDDSDGVPHAESEVHPNDVQLMRIKDILNDAKVLVEMENSPLALYGNHFMTKGVEAQDQPIPIASRLTTLETEADLEVPPTFLSGIGPHIPVQPEEDAMTELTSKTDEDVLRDAFGHLNEDDEDDEDEIIWDPRGSPVISPVLASPKNFLPAPSNAVPSPIQPAISPPRAVTSAPAQSPFITPRPAARVAPTTAEDLLIGFMGANRPTDVPRVSRKLSDPLVPAPPALLPGNNIWSAAQDEQALRFSTSGGQSAPLAGRQHLASQSQDLSQSQSIWSSYPASQGSQHNLVGALPSAPFAPAPHLAMANPTYRTVPSAVAAQLFPSSPIQNNGSPGYIPSLMNQQRPQNGEPSVFNTAYMNAQHAFDPPLGYFDPIGTPHGYHSRHLSLRDSRMSSSVWGNTG